MLMTFRTADGKNCCLAWGEVWSEPYNRTIPGKKLQTTNFYLKYDSDRINGKNSVKTINVTMWGLWAGKSKNLEKHEEIIVFGLIQKDDYQTERQKRDVYKITGQIFIPVSELWKHIQADMAEKSPYPTDDAFAEYTEDIPSFDDQMV